jgi:hypothetical protein
MVGGARSAEVRTVEELRVVWKFVGAGQSVLCRLRATEHIGASMFCAHCGDRCDDAARFCATCGSPTAKVALKSERAVPAPEPPPAGGGEWWTTQSTVAEPRPVPLSNPPDTPQSPTATIVVSPALDDRTSTLSVNELPDNPSGQSARGLSALAYAGAALSIVLVLIVPRIHSSLGILQYFPVGVTTYDGPLKAISWFIVLAGVAAIATRAVADQTNSSDALRAAWMGAAALVVAVAFYAVRSIQLWTRYEGLFRGQAVKYVWVPDTTLGGCALVAILGAVFATKPRAATNVANGTTSAVVGLPTTGPGTPALSGSPVMPTGVVYHQSTNGLAIASLVFSLLYLGGLGSLLGVIFGHVARGQVRRSQGAQSGGGLALAGLLVGYVGVIGAIAFWVLIVALAHQANSGNYGALLLH